MTEDDERLAPPEGGDDEPLAIFERERGRLFGIAYRMLGSVSEAEDILQDAYLRWHAVAPETVDNAPAFLVRLVTRLCLDVLKSARHRRSAYVGPWLPEPLIADDDADNPQHMQELADDLSTAFLLLLERLSPVERAVFLLHESFGFSFAEIAPILGKSEPNCRQIGRRARQHLDAVGRPRPTDRQEHDRLLRLFLQAARDGDVQGMIAVLSHDAVLYADGGGKVQAARQPVLGAVNVARFIVGLARKYAGHVDVRVATVNDRAGVLVYVDGALSNIITLQTTQGTIRQVFLVANPDKLPSVGP